MRSFSVITSFIIFCLIAVFCLSCAHPNAALGDYRGKYVRAGFMLNDSSMRTEVVLTSRGEVFSKAPNSSTFMKKEQLPKLKTKAMMFAVERTGILTDHLNKKGMVSTFYVEYHKRKKTYLWTWGELSFPKEITDVYRDFEGLR